MSSFRTSLSTMRETGSGSPLLTLLAGLIIGLLLGLFVGWVVWPVEWEGAYLSDLTPASRAEYLSAVADSYVVYSSDAALNQAKNRLTNLQGDVLTEIQSAMDYYRVVPSPENDIRIYNLQQLQFALGGVATSAAAQVAAPAAEVPVMVATVAVANSASTLAVEETNGSSWFAWLLTLLAGILLLGGGLYLLQRLRLGGFATASGPRVVGGRNSAVDDYSFDEEPEYDTAAPVAASRSVHTPWLEAEGERKPTQSRPTQPVAPSRQPSWKEPVEEPDFDSDWEDDDLPEEPVAWQKQSRPAPPSLPTATVPSQWRSETADNSALDSAAEDFDDDDELADEEEELDSASLRRPVHAVPASPARFRDEPLPVDNDVLDDDDDDDDVLEDEPPPSSRSVPPPARHRNLEDRTPPRSDPRTQPTRTGSAPAPRYPGSKVVGSFDCAFIAGMGDYDESFNVSDPINKNYIGECGMGVSTKNRILHKNPDEVIALEVWLFDKADGSSLSTQMRVMMSEYASDRYADIFNKERNGEARPFVPQQGVKFQLECPTLILNGEVIDVSYNREGIFQMVKVHMDVLRR